MTRPKKYLPSEDGCCKGHPCDSCRTCAKGRCCRKDNTDYTLPYEGDYDGVLWGAIGVLAFDVDGNPQCHICGSHYSHLSLHSYQSHDVTGREYRALFGLNRTQPLTGKSLSSRMRERGLAHPEWVEAATRAIPARTAEQMSTFGGKRMRRQGVANNSAAHEGRPLGKEACPNGHLYSEENTQIVRNHGGRRLTIACRICKTERNRAYRIRKAGGGVATPA